ncbi:hypothetical protein VNO77_01968 [Canavalia gladiata]|uniref:Uncharacterized protein n=1 Tax=Canavalia gladiata TaxID=3824 RepID=A0AAN9MU43_CANGL
MTEGEILSKKRREDTFGAGGSASVFQRKKSFSLTTSRALGAVIWLAIVVCTVISLKIVFQGSNEKRPFCINQRLPPVQIGMKGSSESDLLGAYYLANQEVAGYHWMVMFTSSMIVLMISVVYLIAGVTVTCSTPTRHGCLKEIASWGLVVLYGGTAFFLRRKAAMILDKRNFNGRNLGLEMLETNNLKFTPEVESQLNEGLKHGWVHPFFLLTKKTNLTVMMRYLTFADLNCCMKNSTLWVEDAISIR